MKSVVTKLFFMFFIFSASLYAQYFIDEDMIREHRNNKNKSYLVPPEKYEGKKLFIMNIGGNRSDVLIGFDKNENNKGDEVTLTIKRDSETIFKDSIFTVTLYPGGGRYEKSFKLNRGEVIEVKTQLPSHSDYHYLSFSIRSRHPYGESLQFGFILGNDPNNPPEKEEYDPNRLRVIPPTNSGMPLDSTQPKAKGLKLDIKPKK